MFHNDFLQKAGQNFSAASANATPSPESRDRTAARLRGNLAIQSGDQQRQIRDQLGNSNQANTGSLDRALRMQRAASSQAFGQGLGAIDQRFEEQRLAGAGILANVGQGFAGLGLGQGNLELGQERLGLDAELGRGNLDLGQERLGLERELGFGGIDLRRELGIGGLELGGEQLDQRTGQESQNALIELLKTMGTVGNARGGQEFTANLKAIIDELIGGI